MDISEPDDDGAAIVGRGTGSRRTSDNLAITFGAQSLRFVIQFSYQIVLARLLGPKEFGLVAIVMPVLAFVQLFSSLGLSQATIQRERLNVEQVNFLFWVNTAAGIVMGLVTMGAAPLVAWFYGEPRALMITVVFGALFMLSGLYAQQLAVMARQMRFLDLAVMDIASFAIGCALAVFSALHGYGYWAIVIGQGTTTACAMVMAWFVAGMRPRWPRRIGDMRELLMFGGNLTTFNVVNYFARNMDNILIGKFLGEQSLGQYDRAYRLMLQPLNQVSQPVLNVAYPALSKAQDDPPTYRRLYFQMLQSIIAITQPGILFALCASKSLVYLLLGAKWSGVAPIFATLAASGICQTINNTTGVVFMSQHRVGEMRNIGIFNSILIVTSFVIGLHWGAVGVAACYVAAQFAVTPIWLAAISRKGHIRRSDLLTALGPHLFACVTTGGVLVLLQLVLPPGPLGLVVQLAASYAVFGGTLAVTTSGRRFLSDVYGTIRLRFAPSRAA